MNKTISGLMMAVILSACLYASVAMLDSPSHSSIGDLGLVSLCFGILGVLGRNALVWALQPEGDEGGQHAAATVLSKITEPLALAAFAVTALSSLFVLDRTAGFAVLHGLGTYGVVHVGFGILNWIRTH